MLIFGERHLRLVLAAYAAHYNGRRPHRSREFRPPRPDHPVAGLSRERIKRRPVLGGLLSEYSGPRRPPGQDRRPWHRPGSERGGVDGMGDSEEGRNRPRAAADRAYLVTVPALPGRGDTGLRLLHRRPGRRHPGLRPGSNRARHQAHPHPRRHPASHRGVDHPACTQPDHGPRRTCAPSQVHDPRPRLQLHRRVRRGPRRRRDPDRAVQRPDAPHERDRRTLDRGMPPRAPGSHPGLEPGPSAADPARIRDSSQSTPAAPLPGRSSAAEATDRAGRSRPVPRPKTGSRAAICLPGASPVRSKPAAALSSPGPPKAPNSFWALWTPRYPPTTTWAANRSALRMPSASG